MRFARRYLGILPILLLSMVFAIAQEKIVIPEEMPCIEIKSLSEDELAFKDGEELALVASYRWGVMDTDVGDVIFKLSRKKGDTGDYFLADGTIKTKRFFSTFFKVNDIYQSKFRASNLRPFYFMRDIKEGRYKKKNFYNYRPDNKIEARIVKNSGKVVDTLLPGRPCTFDLVTLVYFARCLDLSNMNVGDFWPISFALDDDIYNIYIRYDGIETKKISGQGTFRTIKISAQVVAGIVYTGKEELKLWVSDDKNRIPLQIEAPVVLGKVTARLESYKNLKYPLTSKIK